MPRKVLWWTLIKKRVYIKCTDIIKGMKNVCKCQKLWQPNKLLFTIELYQWSVLIPFSFVIIQNEILWCILFANDIVFVNEIRVGANDKLKLWG